MSQMDLRRVQRAGYKLADSGYARKGEVESITKRYIDKYGPDTKVYRVRSDSLRLICYAVYAKM